MTRLLHLDCSLLGPGSVSRRLSAAIVARLKVVDPAIEVSYSDLAANPVPHLTGAYLMAAQTPGAEHTPEVMADLALGAAAMDDFLRADVLVIGLPLYNFGMPSQLKAWLDRIVIAGKTFRYGPDGRPVGLAGDKRAVIAVARGGYYGAGSPTAAFEHGESHLIGCLTFMGITDVQIVVAEGLAVGLDQREAALASAERQIASLAA